MGTTTKNTMFWAAFWVLLAGVAIAAAVVIPKQIQQADEQVRIAQTERAQTERELRELEQKQANDRQQAAVPKTPDEQRIEDIADLAEALEAYEAMQGSYPIASGSDDSLVQVEARHAPCADLLAAGFIERCPRDPAWPDRGYRYRSLFGFSYELTALLDEDDPERCTYIEDLCVYIRKGGLPEANEPDTEDEEEISASLYDAISAAYTRY